MDAFGRIKGFPLMKIQTREIIEKFQKGSFYMNSLRYYRQLYKNYHNEVVGDPYEGKFFVHNAILYIDGDEHVLHDEPLQTANEDDFVFCMFCVNPQIDAGFSFTKEQQEKLTGFHDTVLIILDSDELHRRIYSAAQKIGVDVKAGFVQYYDPTINDATTYLNLLHGMDNIVFHKRKQYQYQQEYRFTVRQPSKNKYVDHLELCIGDISDISKAYPTKEILPNLHISRYSDST